MVWTTTPWTLPANVALAVNPEIEYVKFSLKNYPGISDGIYIVSKKDFSDYSRTIEEDKSKGATVDIIKQIKGKDLVGKKYKPLYPDEAPYISNWWQILFRLKTEPELSILLRLSERTT